MPKDKESILTPEQVQHLWQKMNMKFGAELEALHKRLDKDIKKFGQVSAETIQIKEELMNRILEEKHKNDYQG